MAPNVTTHTSTTGPVPGANGPLPPTSATKDGTMLEGHDNPRDTTREIFETVVFVVVLVLLLKLFVAEAFVIPTGSMATTLWGDQVICTCRECGYKFPINANENGQRVEVVSYICEACGYVGGKIEAREDISSYNSGDRVLVSKYEYHIRSPKRFEVPVFKFPVEPYAEKEHTSMNYIKRFVGLENETIGVFTGDLYQTKALTYPGRPRPGREEDLWQYKYMYPSDAEALERFKAGEFEIIRKNPEQLLTVRRIVFDMEHQPKTPTGIRKQRWHPDPDDGIGWSMDEKGFHHDGDTAGWVRYQHINPWDTTALTAHTIGDHLGYNRDGGSPTNSQNWVPDLSLDCEVEIGNPSAEVTLDLAKATDRFQARFRDGKCTLIRIANYEKGGVPVELGSRNTRMTKPGKYKLRFANVDCRLTVWVDGKVLPFDTKESDYPPHSPATRLLPTPQDGLQPARIGAVGSVKCNKISLWRDIYYTCSGQSDRKLYEEKKRKLDPDWNDLKGCEDFVQTFYVQPNHYLAFGDNSNSSADSRSWGLVPHRLLLGRAIVVYFPTGRLGVIE